MAPLSAPDNVSLRPMTEVDIPAAHALSVLLGWPHRLEDWQMMLRLSHGVVLEEGGKIIGTAFCCVQGRYSTIGLVIVADSHQGRGLGRRLMEAALAAGGTATATLTATSQGAPLYEKLGFVTYGALAQHHGVLETSPAVRSPIAVRPLRADEHVAVQALAQAASSFTRGAVLDEVLKIAERVLVVEEGGLLTGLAVLRPFGRGLMIGPVIAGSTAQAQALIESVLVHCAGRFVRIDVTAGSGLSEWLASVGLPNVDRPVQMTRGKAPGGDGQVTQVGVVTQALG